MLRNEATPPTERQDASSPRRGVHDEPIDGRWTAKRFEFNIDEAARSGTVRAAAPWPITPAFMHEEGVDERDE